MLKADESKMSVGFPPQHPTDQASSTTGVPMPTPALPEYVEKSMPPPSYEEIMGHQTQSSVNHQGPSNDLPPLAYVDIMPRMLNPGNIKMKLAPQFDKFGFVVEVANQWLRVNPGFAVWKCETVERKVEAGPTIEMDKMIMHHSTYGFNVFIRGVRMWLVKKTSPSPSQQLGLMNVVPDKRVIEYSSHVNSRRHFMFDDPYFRTTRMHSYVTYDGLKETIAKLNSKLKTNPIPGTILNVECAMMKTFELFSECDVDPDVTVYTSQHKCKRLTQILRIFYVLGPPSREEICLQEILPAMTRPPQLMIPALWQHWPEVMGQLGVWLANTRGIRVVNIQAFNARVWTSFENAEIMSDCTDEMQASFMDRDYIRIIRVFYTTGSQIQLPPITNFGSRLFLPVRIGRTTFEGMAQTMYRIEAWLRLTGVPIYNVETVQYKLVDTQIVGVDVNKCTWTENPNVGNHYVTGIRVYFPCTFMEPDPSRLPPQPYYDPHFTAGSSECCSVS